VVPGQPIVPTGTSGYQQDSWQAMPDGAFTYRLPLDVPAGRAGMAPRLTLGYSSQAGDGLFGLGWSMSGLSSITRCGQSLSTEGIVLPVSYTRDDRFCLDGQKLVGVGDGGIAYGTDGKEYRTETDSFAKVMSFGGTLDGGPTEFRVATKDGRLRFYSAYSATRTGSAVSLTPTLTEGQKVSKVEKHVWLLDREQDRSGNEIRYEYTADDSHRPYRIWYTGGPNMQAQRYVQFNYAARAAAASGSTSPDAYSAGVPSSLNQLVTSVEMYAPNPGATALVWRYAFSYKTGRTGRALLAGASRSGPNGYSGKRAKTFDYWYDAAAVPAFSAVNLGTRTLNLSGATPPALRVADVDGDGADDAVYTLGGDANASMFLARGSRNSHGAVSPLFDVHLLNGSGDWPAGTQLGASRPMDLQADGSAEFSAHWRQTNGVQRDRILRWDQATGAFRSTGAEFVGTSTNFADMDGDGRTDYLTADVPDGSLKDYSVRLNTSGGSSFFGAPEASPFTSGCPVGVTDTKGDGRAELVGSQLTTAGTCSTTLYALRRNGSNLNTYSMSYQDSTGTVFYQTLPVTTVGSYAPRVGDFNGDGLEDTLLVPTSSLTAGARILWNTGYGLRLDPHVISFPRDSYRDIRVTDVNGDGRDDLVSFHTNTSVVVSKGDGTFVWGDIANSGGTAASNGHATSQVADFTGDGRPDVLRIVNGQLILLVQQPSYADRLASVDDAGSSLPRVEAHYADAWTDHPEKMGDNTCSYPQVCQRRGMVVVRQVRSAAHLVNKTAGTAVLRNLYYSYEDPVTDRRGRGFLGFGTFRTWDPSRPAETVVTFSHRQLVDGKYYPGVGRPATVTTAVPILTPTQLTAKPATATARVTRTYYTAETRKLNGGATYAVFDKSSSTKEWEEPVSIAWGPLGGALGAPATTHVSDITEPSTAVRKTDQSSTHDDYGNVTRQIRSTVGGVYDQVDTGYDNRVADWLVSLPINVNHIRIEPGCNFYACERTDRYTEYHYDPQGRLDVVSVEPNDADPGNGEITRYGYDSLGVVRVVTVSAQNRPDRITHTEYGPPVAGWAGEEIYPSQLWSEHDQAAYRPSTWTAVHPGYGVTVAAEDANGVLASAVYDQQGRPVSTHRDGAADATVSYASRPDLAGYVGTITTTIQAGVTSTVSTDALGRTIETTVSGFDGTKATTTSGYDDLGRIAKVTAPAPGGITTYEYDGLDRLASTTLPDGKTTSASYTFTTTQTVDAGGNKREVTTDVDGRVTKSVEVNKRPDGAQQNITTQYQYAPFDLVDRVTDDQFHVTTMSYDKRGRRTQLTEPDRGSTATTYFGTGEVRTDSHQASGHTTTFGYDDLGRKVSESTEDGTATFTWDVAAHGIGAMASSLSPDSIRTDYRYDTATRLSGTDYTMVGTTLTAQTDQTYDGAGRLATLTYPDAPGRTRAGGNPFTISYGYNAMGYLATLKDVAPDHNTPLWTVTSREPNLALDTATLGNGAGAITVKRSYDSPTGRLHNLAATNPAGTELQNLTYGYDPNGMVLSRLQKDAGTNGADRYEEFGYDSLGRLTAWNLYTGGGEADTSYTYDTIGNLTRIDRSSDAPGSTGPTSETRTYGNADGSQPHALTAVTPSCPSGQACVGDVLTYDSEGRQKSGGGRTTTYTAFDLPKTVTRGGTTTFFNYDAAGQRIFESTGNTSTFTVPGMFERRVVNGTAKYVYYVSSPDGPVAQVVYDGTNADTQYPLVDALGSVTALADGTGKVTRSFHYEPFGGRINADGTPFSGGTGDATHGFTGHEHDDDLGLINMKGRVYDPSQKRFLSPDPVVAGAGNSQSWNPYSYVSNNPLNYTDPTGYIYCDRFCQDMIVGSYNDFIGASSAYYEDGIDGLADYEKGALEREERAAQEQAEIDKAEAAAEANKRPAKSDSEGSTDPGAEDHDGTPEAIDCEPGSGACNASGTPQAADSSATESSCGDWTSTGGGTGLYMQLCSHHVDNVSWFTLHWFNYGSETTIGEVTVYGTTNANPLDSSLDQLDPSGRPQFPDDQVVRPRESDCGGVTVAAGESGWCAGGYGEDTYTTYRPTGFGDVHDGYSAEVEYYSPAGGWMKRGLADFPDGRRRPVPLPFVLSP
jgi:RHS repeat-associated protein